MKTKLFYLALFLCLSLGIQAQNYEYSNVQRFSTRSTGPIIKDEAIKGYYVFYPEEKVDRKNIAFKISLLDDNLTQTATFDLVRPKKYILIESSFNSNAFVFNFYDPKSKTMEYVSFDRSGKELGSVKSDKVSTFELAAVKAIVANPEVTTTNIFPVGDNGFVRLANVDNRKYGYVVSKYDNTLHQLWAYGSDVDSKLIERADVLSADENHVLLQIAKSKSQMTAKFDTYLILLDTKTGKELYNFQMQDDNEGQLSVLNAFIIDDSGDALVVGEFYAPNDNVLKDKSLGIYARGVERNGEYSVFKKYHWDGEIAKVKRETMDDDEKDNDKGTNQIYFHHFVRAQNGHVFAIAEQFKKQASALGIASMVLSGGNSNTAASEIKITNMVVAEFDKDLKLVDYSIIPKKKTRVYLPAGSSLLSPQKLGYYVKSIGGFDYNFTSKNIEKDSYHAVYTDFNRKDDESKEKSDAMVGSINIVDGKMTADRFPVNTDANLIWFNPAKPGYVLVGEYYRKGKRVTMRLEKITI